MKPIVLLSRDDTRCRSQIKNGQDKEDLLLLQTIKP